MNATSLAARRSGLRRVAFAWSLALLLAPASAVAAFLQTNLVSSVAGLAGTTDANLRNPWGIALSASGPFWVADQVTSKATLYNGAGQRFPVASPLVVSIAGTGPTGSVSNATADFEIGPGLPAAFIFATLDGFIVGWNPTVNPTAAIIMVRATDGAVYTGLALGNNGAGNFLYAADAANNKIDVYDAHFHRTTLVGSFTDPVLPSGFTAYNIQKLGSTLFVTYENESAGGGIVDAFDLNGNFVRRVTQNAAGGPLDSPWGLAIAPAGFGSFGGALLVGNEGNGRISAFNPATGQFLGQLLDAKGNPIANPGLWGIVFGNGGNGGDVDKLYFAAGIQGEQQGLFGSIAFQGAACMTTLSGRGTPAGRSPARIDLAWTAIASAHHLDVQRATASGGPYMIVGSTTSTTFADTVGLVSGSSYFYVLQARTASNAPLCESSEGKITIPAAR